MLKNFQLPPGWSLRVYLHGGYQSRESRKGWLLRDPDGNESWVPTLEAARRKVEHLDQYRTT